MTKRISMFFVLGCALAACAGTAPGGGGGGDDGGGDGTGGGSGGGDGSGSGGGDGSGGGGGSTDTSGLESFVHGLGVKYCDEAFACKASFPTDAGITFDEAFGPSAMACYADNDASFDIPAIVAQIQAGTILWNASDANTCLAGITFGTCEEFWQQGGNEPAACATALAGTIADGGACVTDWECVNLASYCDETTKLCTVDTGEARTAPSTDFVLHVRASVLR